MTFGRVNASARKMRLGIVLLHLADQPFPEREGFGVRVVHAEDAYALRRSRTAPRSSVLPKARASAPFRNRAGRCPGISWAGSRRTEWCRPAGGGTIRDAPARRDDPASTEMRCRARAPVRARPPSPAAVRNPPACRARDGSLLWPPSAAPMAQGLPASSGLRAGSVVLAFAKGRCRWGGWAAGTVRRNPWPRHTAGGLRNRGTCRARPAAATQSGETSRTRC